MWRNHIVLKRAGPWDPLGQLGNIQAARVQIPRAGIPLCLKTKRSVGRDGQRWPAGVLRGGWEVEREHGESVSTEAAAPWRGRTHLPEAESWGARGMRSSFR